MPMARTTRKIIDIDEIKCNGCGQCVTASPKGPSKSAMARPKLVAEVYCDGLGACLGECPEGAITITEREADRFRSKRPPGGIWPSRRGRRSRSRCHHSLRPGRPRERVRRPGPEFQFEPARGIAPHAVARTTSGPPAGSQLSHWPIQLRLVPPGAPFLAEAELLLVADCVPFAYADFHHKLLRGRPVLIACPKLDERVPELERLTAILTGSTVRSLTVVHMEVPCCTGLVRMAEAAIAASGRSIPLDDITISIRGERR